MNRVMFDTNAGFSRKGGYFLHFQMSARDLAAMGDDLKIGARVILYMPDELEMEAILDYEEEHGGWVGIPVPGTIKHIDK